MDNKLEELARARKLLVDTMNNASFPAALRAHARDILKTLRLETAEVTRLIGIVNDTNATLANRQRALELIGQIIIKEL
jgi:hypothetical protein